MTDPSSSHQCSRPRFIDLATAEQAQLHAELWHLRLAQEGADLALQAAVRKTEEQRQRAEKAEAELAALKTIATGYCPECGRGDCSPTAQQWLDQRDRANEAEAAIARVRAVHVRNGYTGDCEHCSAGDYPNYAVPNPCPTIRALNGTT
ncbi:hypothetical protein ACWEP8_37205 [Streptomyces hydrogenans]